MTPTGANATGPTGALITAAAHRSRGPLPVAGPRAPNHRPASRGPARPIGAPVARFLQSAKSSAYDDDGGPSRHRGV